MSVCFIIPYFGKFPEWFAFWLKTCEYNKEFHWLIFTDDDRDFLFPENVKVVYTTLKKLEKDFSNKLGFSITIDRAYKLCDYKPLYGFLFQEELSEYTHWGYTDIDTLWGDLSEFITPELLQKYDKIQTWGHLSVYKNLPSINEAFRKCEYRKMLDSNANFIFDESSRTPNINQILLKDGRSVFGEIKYADIGPSNSNFVFVNSLERKDKKRNKGAIFEYVDGKVYATYLENGKLSREEFAYVHFQKRKIEVHAKVENRFLLVPNEIVCWRSVDIAFMEKYQKGKKIYFLKKRANKVFWRIKNEYNMCISNCKLFLN